MITRTVKRYYCEHCGKGGQTKAIADHEATCFHNPDRSCRLCDFYGLTTPPMPRLIRAAVDHGLDRDGGVRSLTGCPACIASTCIQARMEEFGPDLRFDYQTEIKAFRETKGWNLSPAGVVEGRDQ